MDKPNSAERRRQERILRTTWVVRGRLAGMKQFPDKSLGLTALVAAVQHFESLTQERK